VFYMTGQNHDVVVVGSGAAGMVAGTKLVTRVNAPDG
jgi:succinate dehydrogenase/fumarate reductase flavoprotein subunit